MEDIENCDEELVGILLLVAGKMSGVGPDQVEQLEWDVGAGDTRVELRVCVCSVCVRERD